MGNMAKQKGKRGEREAADLLGSILGKSNTGADRIFGDVQAQGGDIQAIEGLSIEVKRHETLAINTWWKQAVRQASDTDIPVLMYRQNRKPWRFCIPAYCLVISAPGYIDIDELTFGHWLNQYLIDLQKT